MPSSSYTKIIGLLGFLTMTLSPVRANHQLSTNHKDFVNQVHDTIEKNIEADKYSRQQVVSILDQLITTYSHHHTYVSIFDSIQDKIERGKNIEIIHTEPSNNFAAFPDPQYIHLEKNNKTLTKPIANNTNRIFRHNDNNNTHQNLYDISMSIDGAIPAQVQKVEVIRDGDMDSYFLKNYQPGSTTFLYNIHEQFNNIKKGKNQYLIRGYANNHKILERIMHVTYFPPKQQSTQNTTNSSSPHSIPTTKINKKILANSRGTYSNSNTFDFISQEENSHTIMRFYETSGTYIVTNPDFLNQNTAFQIFSLLSPEQKKLAYEQYTVFAETFEDDQGKNYIRFIEFMN